MNENISNEELIYQIKSLKRIIEELKRNGTNKDDKVRTDTTIPTHS